MVRARIRTASRAAGSTPAAERPPVGDDALPAPVMLTDADRAVLLDLARTAIAAAVGATGTASITAARARHAPIGRRAAAFVTLTEDGELRGCIGHMDPALPVEESVITAAFAASLDDPRFAPVRREELPRIHVEVSVLGPVAPLPDPARMRLGIDGIIVERGGRRGLLLPEVAPMLGNDRTAMFETACRKAGLPGSAWRDPGTRLSVFRTDRFGGAAVAAPG
jgi:AmmeMemoRadiSam system protein A